jgi:hypothetical protein
MFHWKIIITLIILQILSLIFTHLYEKKDDSVEIEQEKKDICINPITRDFILSWIRFTVNMINYSRSIIKESEDVNNYYSQLQKTKDDLINSFSKIYSKYADEFKDLINKQISIKTDLCDSIVDKEQDNVKKFSEELSENTNNLTMLFIKIKNNKDDDLKLKQTMTKHTNTYIKSLSFAKKASGDELDRELVLGSLDTAKLLFI